MIKEAIRQYLYTAIGIVFIFSYLLMTFTLARLNILPSFFLILALAVPTPIVIWMTILHFKTKLSLRTKVIISSLSLVLTGICFYIFVSLNATGSFLSSLGSDTQAYETYSVIAKKERHITLDTAGSAALMKNDANIDAVSSEMSKLTHASQTRLEGLSAIVGNLKEDKYSVGVVTNSQLELSKEMDQPFFDTTEVLATFKVKVTSTKSSVNTAKPFVVYISGIDTYGEISAVSRSDVNMLAVINPVTHKILLVNTPRDYYVQLHGTTGVRDKLTHAGIYGIDMSRQTMEDLYHVSIDSYIRVNFSSLVSVVDALGSINVYSDYSFKGFKEGYNEMNGAQALAFSRERYSFSEGDRTRGKNQQRVIEAIVDKLSSSSVLVNYSATLSTLQASIQTNISGDKVSGLVKRQLEGRDSWKTESISVDGTGKQAPTFSAGNTLLYVMEPNSASLEAAKQRIQTYLQ